MKIEVLIDGYNFLRARAGVRLTSGPGGLHRARAALLRWLAERCPLHHSITVIFDAARPTIPYGEPAEQTHHGIRVRFAHHYPDADSLIAELIAASHTPKQLLVVSNDRAVQRSAKRRGARPIACEAFEAHLLSQAKESPQQQERRAKRQSPSAKERAYWLEIFGNDASQAVTPPEVLPKRPEPTSTPPTPASPAREPKCALPAKRPKKRERQPLNAKEIPKLGNLADFYQAMRAAEEGDRQETPL